MCNDTLYGCCLDGYSVSLGNDYEGCPVVILSTSTTSAPDIGCNNTQ